MQSHRQLLQRYARAAKKHKPDPIRLLLVAHSPPLPADPPRYFYFEDTTRHDWLFRGVARTYLDVDPEVYQKRVLLKRLMRKGLFLIDIKPDPLDTTSLGKLVPSLIQRCWRLRPKRIILIKVDVYDAAYELMRLARLPVAKQRIPFPNHWPRNQTAFAKKFKAALGS